MGTCDAKGSVLGAREPIYFPAERSEPVYVSAAGENYADYKADMADFTSKCGTSVVYG